AEAEHDKVRLRVEHLGIRIKNFAVNLIKFSLKHIKVNSTLVSVTNDCFREKLSRRISEKSQPRFGKRRKVFLQILLQIVKNHRQRQIPAGIKLWTVR